MAAEYKRELASLYVRLFRQYPFFTDSPHANALLRKLPEMTSYCTAPKNFVVFREGDPSDLLYIILSGEVKVYKQDHELKSRGHRGEVTLETRRCCAGLLNVWNHLLEDNGEEPLSPRTPKRIRAKDLSRSSSFKKPDNFTSVGSNGNLEVRSPRQVSAAVLNELRERNKVSGYPAGEEHEWKRAALAQSCHFWAEHACRNRCFSDKESEELFGGEVSSLSVGALFGELALRDDGLRVATIRCATACEFLVVGRGEHDHFLQDLFREAKLKYFRERIAAVLELQPLFANLPASVRHALSGSARWCRRREGDLLFHHGDKPDFCYFILFGEVVVWRALGSAPEPIQSNHRASIFESRRRGSDEAGNQDRRGTMVAGLPMLDNGYQSRRGSATVPENNQQDSVVQVGCKKNQRIFAEVHDELLDSCKTPWFSHAMILTESSKSWFGRATDEEFRDGSQEVATVLGPGMCFGEMALFADRRRQATVTCKTDCDFLVISRSGMAAALQIEVDASKMLPMYARPLIKVLPFCEDMSELTQEAVAQILQYKRVAKNETLFMEGDVADVCYIILAGEVELLRIDEPFVPGKTWTQRAAPPACVKECKDLVAAYGPNCEAPPEEILTRAMQSVLSCSGNRIDLLGPGMTFGEVAMINNDAPRGATAICTEDCHFLVIPKTEFTLVLTEELQKRALANNRVNISKVLQDLSICSPGGSFSLEDGQSLWNLAQGKLLDLVHYVRRRQGHVLFWEDDEPDMCYIILTGEVAIWREIRGRDMVKDVQEGDEEAQEEDVKLTMPPLECADKEQQEKCECLASLLQIQEGKNWNKGKQPTLCRQGTRREPFVPPHTLPVALLGQGMLLGEVALLSDVPRNATATCHTDCEFLTIHEKEFKSLFTQAILQAKRAKVDFLAKAIPKLLAVSEAAQLGSVIYFKYCSFPRNHVFYTQGESGNGNVYIVKQGSVELRVNAQGQQRAGIWKNRASTRSLLTIGEGGVFASARPKTNEPYTALVVTPGSQFYCIKNDHLKELPEVVATSLKLITEQAVKFCEQRRVSLPSASPPAGETSLVDSSKRHSTTSSNWSSAQVGAKQGLGAIATREKFLGTTLPTLDMKVACTKAFDRRAAAGHRLGMSSSPRTSSESPLRLETIGKVSRRLDMYEEFTLIPGELLATKGRMPKPRDKKYSVVAATPANLPGLGGMATSQSAPFLRERPRPLRGR